MKLPASRASEQYNSRQAAQRRVADTNSQRGLAANPGLFVPPHVASVNYYCMVAAPPTAGLGGRPLPPSEAVPHRAPPPPAPHPPTSPTCASPPPPSKKPSAP